MIDNNTIAFIAFLATLCIIAIVGFIPLILDYYYDDKRKQRKLEEKYQKMTEYIENLRKTNGDNDNGRI